MQTHDFENPAVQNKNHNNLTLYDGFHRSITLDHFLVVQLRWIFAKTILVLLFLLIKGFLFEWQALSDLESTLHSANMNIHLVIMSNLSNFAQFCVGQQLIVSL